MQQDYYSFQQHAGPSGLLELMFFHQDWDSKQTSRGPFGHEADLHLMTWPEEELLKQKGKNT